MTTEIYYKEERMSPAPHTLLETLAYTNNCVRSLTDKIRSCEKKLDFEVASLPQNVDKILSLSGYVAKAKIEKDLAHQNRALARKAIDELFYSLRG